MIRHWTLELLHKIATDYMSCCGFILYGGGGKGGDAPDPPDYAAAAVAQGKASLEAARATAKLNNPNIINPYGTQTVTYCVKRRLATIGNCLSAVWVDDIWIV